MDEAAIFEGLNDEQRRAVELVRGPLCILAGAGSGKTTTITRRIANQVATGAFRPEEILAVTFTDKAAGEMRARLAALRIDGVRARTFHSAALAQLRHLAEEPPGDVLPSKAPALRQLANRLPKPYRFRPAGDLATEIEWAKNRRITPESYLYSLGGHEPPIPADLMQRIFRDYEAGKQKRNLIDFEDLLELAIRMFATDDYARDTFHSRYLAFTVDEFQDVNLLQHSLLQCWIGERDNVCAVGDDYQSIYGFTGASPQHLLALPGRYPRTTVVRLEANYRSSPEILDVANRLVGRLGGARKTLRATRPPGPAPVMRWLTDESSETAAIVRQIGELHDDGVRYEDIAILYRTNFRSEEFEEALARARIPFQVRDGAFLSRAAARRIVSLLGRSKSADLAAETRRCAEREGWREDGSSENLGEQELTRQNDLARLVRLAEEFDDGAKTAADFIVDLKARFASDGEGRGVNLLTYHRAKGLEFEAVFLPRLNEGDMPFRRSRSDEAVAEERRLLYVGITRAKQHLRMSWLLDRKRKASRFLTELQPDALRRPGPGREGAERQPEREKSPASVALRAWRSKRAQADGVPAYVVLHDSTLEEIATRRPRTELELGGVAGIGPAKLQRYGSDILKELMDEGGA